MSKVNVDDVLESIEAWTVLDLNKLVTARYDLQHVNEACDDLQKSKIHGRAILEYPALIGGVLRLVVSGVLRDGDVLGRLLDTFVAAHLRAELPVAKSRPGSTTFDSSTAGTRWISWRNSQPAGSWGSIAAARG